MRQQKATAIKRRSAASLYPGYSTGFSKPKRSPASHAFRLLPSFGIPPDSLSIRARCMQFQVMMVVFRCVKSLSKPTRLPPFFTSPYEGPGPASPSRSGRKRDNVSNQPRSSLRRLDLLVRFPFTIFYFNPSIVRLRSLAAVKTNALPIFDFSNKPRSTNLSRSVLAVS